MAKCRTISSTDGFAFIFVKNDPQNRKTEQKNIPEERPRPPGIFLSRRKIDSFTIDKIAIIWQRKAASEEIFDHPNSRFMAFTGEDAGTFRVIFQGLFCPMIGESKRKFSPRRGFLSPHLRLFCVIFGGIFCPPVGESKRKFFSRRGLFCPRIWGLFASFFRFFIPKA